ncbi:MAG: hypothetical protein LBV60_00250 [Streptomyces sp.]|jgi:hypothetical protein|nr:hypothetical protein [Streptomyces sp.]
MSLVRRAASATVLAVTVTGAVLSLAGAASAETGGAHTAPPVVACCGGVSSASNGSWSGTDSNGGWPGTDAPGQAISASTGNDAWK